MALLKHIGLIGVLSLFVGNAVGEQPADQPVVEWLRGSGKDLQICVKGEIFEADGRPAAGVQVTGRMNAEISSKPLPISFEGNRFTIWFRVSEPHWYSAWLIAKSADGQSVAYKTLNQYQLRQAAIDGIKLTLQSPTRQVVVKVIDKGQPVANAEVKAELAFGIELRSKTNTEGVARIELLPRQEVSRLTAWTDDHRIGGYSFNRSPPRDPNADEYELELNKCREQRIRFVDQAGSPVPGVDFALQIATPPPDYNFVGTNEHSRMTTNAAGEAVFQWFPDWDKVYYYADIGTGQWVLDGKEPKTVDGVAIFKLKKGRPRQRVEGRVTSTETSLAGFYAQVQSFQGEREHYSDHLRAFTDADGKFAVDVLPDATYCVYVVDERWVGKSIDLILYDSATGKSNPLELPVSAGQEAQVIVTTGPEKKPFPNLTINLRRNHDYSWREDGKTRYGSGGPQWWVVTDDSGRATTRTLPGKMTASIYTPRWHSQKEINVVASEPAKFELHREIDKSRSIAGRLVLDQGVTANLADAEIKIGSVDGNYEEQQESACGKDGSFAFDIFAAELGVFGRTKDGRAAGSMIVKDLASPIVVHLHPTTDYEGQLLGENDQPVVGHPVQAIVRIEGKTDISSPFSQSFEARRIDAKTDEQGNFTLPALPSETKVNLRTNRVGDSSESVFLGEVYLDINESRPRTISRMARNAANTKKLPLAERYKSTLRDCALNGYRPMLVIANESEDAKAFIDKNYLDYSSNKEVYPFMQIVVRISKNAARRCRRSIPGTARLPSAEGQPHSGLRDRCRRE